MHDKLQINTNMRLSLCNCTATIFLVLLLISSAIFATHIESPNQYGGDNDSDVDHEGEGESKGKFWGERENMMEKLGGAKDEKNSVKRRTLDVAAGSRIPDCSHACGSCSPCKLVMVSLTCADAAETCPISYRCICNTKSYPVP